MMLGKDPRCCDGSRYSWRALYGRLLSQDTCWAHETLAQWL